MSLSDDARYNLVRYRIQRAHETWNDTKCVISEKSTHAGVIRMLGLHFVNTGILSKELGRFYSSLFEFRQRDDYEDYVVINAEDVLSRVPLVEKYLCEVEKLIMMDFSNG